MAAAVLMVVCSGTGVYAFARVHNMVAGTLIGVPWPIPPSAATLAVTALLAALVIIAAAGLLKLRTWARTVLEALTWLGLVYIIGSWIAFLPMLARLSGWAAFDWYAALMATAVALIYAVPGVFVLRAIRARRVRDAMVPPEALPSALDA
jgi:hypothetical protein